MDKPNSDTPTHLAADMKNIIMVTNIESLKAPIQSLVSMTSSLHSDSHTKLINSAASNHISGTLLLFSNMIKITPVTIQMASGDSFTANQSRTIHIKVMSVMLK